VAQIDQPPLGSNAAFRKVAFEKYGLFRTDLRRSGEHRGITSEDTEFGHRLTRSGEKMCIHLMRLSITPSSQTV
jgi:hypothetical protein